MNLFPFISNTDEIKVDNSFPMYKEIAWDFKRNTPIIQNGDFKIFKTRSLHHLRRPQAPSRIAKGASP